MTDPPAPDPTAPTPPRPDGRAMKVRSPLCSTWGIPERAKRFLDVFLLRLNITEAALAAGYCEQQAGRAGRRILRNGDCQRYLAHITRSLRDRWQIDLDWVIGRLVAEAQNPDASAAARIQAVTKLGEHFGMFATKIKVEHSGEIKGESPRTDLDAERVAAYRTQLQQKLAARAALPGAN